MQSRELFFGLYVAGRYLQELAVALRLIGVESWYARPGVAGVVTPRLYVKYPGLGWVDDAICATCQSDAGRPEWWFMWSSGAGVASRICRPGDMVKAARLIVGELSAELRA